MAVNEEIDDSPVDDQTSVGFDGGLPQDAELEAQLRAIASGLLASTDISKLLETFANTLGGLLDCSRVLVFRQSSLRKRANLVEWHESAQHPLDEKLLANIVQQFRAKALKYRGVLQFRAMPDGPPWAKAVLKSEATYLAVTSLRHVDNPVATVILLRNEDQGAWSPEEISVLKYLCDVVAKVIARDSIAQLQNQGILVPEVSEQTSLYRRMVENADALIFSTDTKHGLTYINQRSSEFFGVPPEDFIGQQHIQWVDLLHVADRERIWEKLKQAQAAASGFEDEARVINHVTGEQRWLIIRYTPVIDLDGRTIGWDGFASDTTRRIEAQQALTSQGKRVRALYSVSSAIRGYFDTVSIANGGLAALCEATGADAAFCFVAQSNSEIPQLVAQHGLSKRLVNELESNEKLPAVASYVVDDGSPAIIDDLRTDPRASSRWVEEENMRSAIVVPIRLEESSLGAIGLFHREPAHFSSADVMLVTAAANQIGLAARQANLFAAYRKQTRNLAALYRLSHELSGSQTLEQIFGKAFSIIRDEIGVKRLWLGLLNETGTRIVGQGAMGPGWKRRLVEMNVEVIGKNHPIAQVVRTRRSRILSNPDEILDEFGVKRFFSRFSFNAVGLIPLVAAGQLLGVLAFQPSSMKRQEQEEEMTLLGSLASEIAAAILAKRFDERVAEGEKMRTTGLLAAGIAHNFNNLLQAILGQASLLELQQLNSEQVGRAAGIINDAAAKGATLVRQLMSFAHLEEPHKEFCDVNQFIEMSRERLAGVLDDSQKLKFTLAESNMRAHVDSTQLLRILSSLLTNASEASPSESTIEIFSNTISVTKEAPHFEVPLGDYVRIGVRDNGAGMDEVSRRRCFEPFYTTKDLDPASGLSMSGAGLGLAAAFALARKNGGRLVVDSRKGHGSVFTLYLPVAEPVLVKGANANIEKLQGNNSVPHEPSLTTTEVHTDSTNPGEIGLGPKRN